MTAEGYNRQLGFDAKRFGTGGSGQFRQTDPNNFYVPKAQQSDMRGGRTVNINVNGQRSAVNVGSDSDVQALEGVIRSVGDAAYRS